MFIFLYEHCYRLGKSFGYGAFEGMILYASIIMLGITSAMNKKGGK